MLIICLLGFQTKGKVLGVNVTVPNKPCTDPESFVIVSQTLAMFCFS